MCSFVCPFAVRRWKARGEAAALRSSLEATRRQLEASQASGAELARRVAELEQLQAQARQTVLLSEAKLRATEGLGGGSSRGEEAGGCADGTAVAPAVQLWWVELAQQLKQEARHAERPGSAVRFAPLPGEHHHDAHFDDHRRSVDGGAFGAQLAAAREREASLAQAVRDQGLEVVFLRQELVARGIELRRAREDAAAQSAVAERRIGALEASVRRCSSEQATKVRELEASVRALSGKSDAHAQLLEARSALQV